MKIAIVNDIHVGRCLESKGKIRAYSHLIEDRLNHFLEGVVSHHSPDVIINLGDLIRSESREADVDKYRQLISNFKKLELPVVHLVGNHELKKMVLEDVESIWSGSGFDQKSYGCKNIGDFTVIWLGLEQDPDDHSLRSLPSYQMDWLKDCLARTSRPAFIFTHCAIDDQDVTGNFFYEGNHNQSKQALFLENQDDIRKIISTSNCVVAVLQAHLHYFHAKKIDHVPYITCPAMGDNICGPNALDNVPEICTIVSLEKGRLTVKAFSGEYCFAGYETDRPIS